MPKAVLFLRQRKYFKTQKANFMECLIDQSLHYEISACFITLCFTHLKNNRCLPENAYSCIC
jgi:hypothetical protein